MSSRLFDSSFSILHDITLCGHPEVSRTGLFRNTSIIPKEWRDSELGDGGNLGYFASDTCPAATARPGRTLVTKRRMTFLQMAAAIVGEGTTAEISRRIVEHTLDITGGQFQDLVNRANTELVLVTDGHWNFAFTQTGKQLSADDGEYPGLAVLWARRHDSFHWSVSVRRLGYNTYSPADHGLVLGNRI